MSPVSPAPNPSSRVLEVEPDGGQRMTTLSADEYSAMIKWDIESADATRPRSMLEGHVGMSSMRCREEVRRLLLKMPASDSPSKSKAIMGTAVDGLFKHDLALAHPDWLFDLTVRATLPSGFEITGTLDWADPAEPSVTDLKTKDEDGMVHAVKHWASEDSYRRQRHVLYLGMIQNHDWPENGLVRNLVVDRSGKKEDYLTWQEPFDRAVIREADDFLQDAMYAVKHEEEAQRDIAGHLCKITCSFFTACRGTDVTVGRISTPQLANAADLYAEYDAMEKEGKAGKAALRGQVLNVNGYTALTKITTTKVNAANGSQRILVERVA